MSETLKAQREQLAHMALTDRSILEGLIGRMGDSSRRVRQNAAATLACAAAIDPTVLSPYVDPIIAGLERPEAQTRWECLDILSSLVSHDFEACEKALMGAEAALFDEDSGPLRLAAVRFLCRFGSVSADCSVKVWPLIDEAIQCYHGDLEFQEMLIAICAFSESNLDVEVAASLKARMEFDARNAKGVLKKRAQHIIDNVCVE